MDLSKLKNDLLHDEGLRLSAYRDTVGLWTIGVGHLLGGETAAPRMTRISYEEAMALLDYDIQIALQRAKSIVGDPAFDWIKDDARPRALTNMAFNLGDRLREFKNFLSAVREGRWPDAATHMMESKWARQVGKRAQRLRDLILSGDELPPPV